MGTMNDQRRYPELDAMRGIALLLMMLYHLLFDLQYFYGYDIGIGTLVGSFAARGIASIFLVLIGICFVISWNRTPASRKLRKTVLRTCVILSCAVTVSAATWWIDPDAFVKFGILHLIGVSVIFQPLFSRLGRWNALVGILIIVIGILIQGQATALRWLFVLGIPYDGFRSLDYYPLLPWFGVVLVGMGIGTHCYLPSRRTSWDVLGKPAYPSWLLSMGRHALLLYMVHQPIILGILWMALR